ncbi:bifunctional adenosylcobinamide kinase/adenosylcobinamide-phosphate guanylyltransferase [Sporosarcina sp. JAI121]|uniref:bifunctional adenosylcobinamide kinase/adenosylcobinamide-phosphate guanylyltransferase n=1 Tax=Sporosarcina sp. JAI121 TaxID=2723064 RepID=UPI001845F5FC|nr:bifunctional adenosylcobinamide kinase/adenosylcobinamide-phosphate guanylyltransferase [Sporosarcina sp. JAI121]NYF23455.1 L-threonine-O-3-phosphate decarboxylase [Sporosarcina sp. JAI121]
MQLPEHGANPRSVYARLGMEPPARLLDFSENVNPAGPPESVAQIWPQLLDRLKAYPNPEGEPFLSAAADYHGISVDYLFAGNGAAELLALLAERYRGKRAIVVHPTFSEYEATLTAKSVEIVRVLASEDNGFKLPLEAILDGMDSASVVYICTPNNPTGILPAAENLFEIIRYGAEVGCDVVLDEAFIDFVDESLSFIPEIMNNPHLIIVRSMTKMYAIPGIRLGYVAADPTVIKEIKARAPHWNVNGLAAQIGAVCLQEESYREQAIQRSNLQREKMTQFLLEYGCTVTDSVTNFIAFTLGPGRDSEKLYRDMLARGIVLRHSENFRGMDGRWLRIGMKNPADMAVLKEELRKWLEENPLGDSHPVNSDTIQIIRPGKLTFVSGGVRSGKSSYAERLLVDETGKNGGRLVYIASGTATDPEMKLRIDWHRQDRSNHSWTTVEQPVKLEEVLPAIQPADYVLWDCVTTWLANELYTGWETGKPCIGQLGCMEKKEMQLYETIDAILGQAAHLVIVSNEVLDELPSEYVETEIYSMWLGRIHQKLVALADTAVEMDYGIPIVWKSERQEVTQ